MSGFMNSAKKLLRAGIMFGDWSEGYKEAWFGFECMSGWGLRRGLPVGWLLVGVGSHFEGENSDFVFFRVVCVMGLKI